VDALLLAQEAPVESVTGSARDGAGPHSRLTTSRTTTAAPCCSPWSPAGAEHRPSSSARPADGEWSHSPACTPRTARRAGQPDLAPGTYPTPIVLTLFNARPSSRWPRQKPKPRPMAQWFQHLQNLAAHSVRSASPPPSSTTSSPPVAARSSSIRRIAGLDSMDEAVGRLTEMGKPILFCAGHQRHRRYANHRRAQPFWASLPAWWPSTTRRFWCPCAARWWRLHRPRGGEGSRPQGRGAPIAY
jgi:hypothetical protein